MHFIKLARGSPLGVSPPRPHKGGVGGLGPPQNNKRKGLGAREAKAGPRACKGRPVIGGPIAENSGPGNAIFFSALFLLFFRLRNTAHEKRAPCPKMAIRALCGEFAAEGVVGARGGGAELGPEGELGEAEADGRLRAVSSTGCLLGRSMGQAFQEGV